MHTTKTRRRSSGNDQLKLLRQEACSCISGLEALIGQSPLVSTRCGENNVDGPIQCGACNVEGKAESLQGIHTWPNKRKSRLFYFSKEGIWCLFSALIVVLEKAVLLLMSEVQKFKDGTVRTK